MSDRLAVFSFTKCFLEVQNPLQTGIRSARAAPEKRHGLGVFSNQSPHCPLKTFRCKYTKQHPPYQRSKTIMASRTISNRTLCRIGSTTRQAKTTVNPSLVSRRSFYRDSTAPVLINSSSRRRPTLQPLHQPVAFASSAVCPQSRSIFIQTQTTPNADVCFPNP
jgi:hypothetical protein